MRDEGYPLPPVFNWLSPQDVVNEVRESRRAHRRRLQRKYTYRKGSIAEPELDKLQRGGDGTFAEDLTAPGEASPIKPVPDAPLGPDTDKDLVEAKDDFQQITGVGGEQRGVSESDTATQANIIDVRTRIRESAGRAVVAEWLGDICRIMLLTIREKMQLPMWIKVNTDLTAPDPNEILAIAQTWQEITAEQLGTGNLDVQVDVTSLSPVSEDMQRQQWLQGVLPILTNPGMAMVLSMSETLLRKTLKMFGITSAREIQEIAKVLQMVAMAGAAQAQPPTSSGSGQPAAGQPAASAPMVQ